MTSSIISVLKTKPVILIDESYYIFNRYYATCSWYKRKSDEELDHDNIIDNKEFIISFFRHFEADMIKIIKKFKTVKSNIIFCTDCSRCHIWRNEFYDEYKATRAKKANFNSEIFTLFKNYIFRNEYQYCDCDNLEADDVAYLLQKKIKNEIEKTYIVIITNDSDYLQLFDKNVFIINMQFKDLSLKINSNPITELQLKIIYGDKSDNIPKIQYGLSKEKALNLAKMSNEDLLKYLEKNNILEKYNLNKKLVDLSQIPQELINIFYNKYHINSI